MDVVPSRLLDTMGIDDGTTNEGGHVGLGDRQRIYGIGEMQRRTPEFFCSCVVKRIVALTMPQPRQAEATIASNRF